MHSADAIDAVLESRDDSPLKEADPGVRVKSPWKTSAPFELLTPEMGIRLGR